MSENSVSSFVARNKTAIIATAAAGITAIGAGYYYYNLRNQVNFPDDDETTSSSTSSGLNAKKKKKKLYKKKKRAQAKANKDIDITEEESISNVGFPVDANGEPDLSQISTAEDKEQYAVKLKDYGNQLFKQQKLDEAIKYYTLALELKKDPVFYANRSACYAAMGNQEKVVEDTTTALELNPEYSKCRLRRASANEALGKYEDAMLDVSALSLFGDYNNASIESMLERILNKRVTENLEGRLKEQQKESHKKLISATDLASFFGSFKPELTFDDYDPENKADVLLKEALETLYAKTLHGFETADEKFAEAIKLYKEANDDKNNKKYAIALEYSGVLDFFKMDAISSFEKVSKAIELNPRAQSYIFMGLINADKAAANGEDYMADLNKAIELDPQNSSAYYHRAQYKFISKDLEGAAKDFEKSKELDPEFVFPYIQLACLTYREGKFSDCETLFSEAKRKFPKAPEVPSFYGEVLTDHGDYAKASKQYDAAIKLEEECAPTIHLGVNPWVAKATVLVAEPTVENFVEAVNLLEKANELDPKSSKVKLTLGQLKLQQSELDEAIQLFDAAADLTMNAEEKVGAIRLVEASKVQKKLHADPFLSKKINELLASIQGGGFGI